MKVLLLLVSAIVAACADSQTPFSALTSVIGSTTSSVDIGFVWLTNATTTTSVVRYARADNTGNSTSSRGTAVNYLPDSVFIHHVEVKGLSPDTAYIYSVGDTVTGFFSANLTLQTPPAAAGARPGSSALRVGFFGDMGVDASAVSTMSLFTESAKPATRGAEAAIAGVGASSPLLSDVDVYYSLGDHTYADDRKYSAGYETFYNTFQARWHELAAHRPLQVLPGNHDVTCHSYGKFFCPKGLDNFTAFQNRWHMPAHDTQRNVWWSADIGPVHFVAINTETDLPKKGDGPEGMHSQYRAGNFGDQVSWLVEDLRRAVANRGSVPWIIVTGHRPIFTAHVLDWPPGLQFLQRDLLQPIFEEFKVDAYLSGHVHGYERHWPIRQSKKVADDYHNPPGVVYVVAGNAGNIEGHTKISGTYHESWMAVRNEATYGALACDFHNATHATFSMIASTNATVLDSFTLSRDRT
eukprot:TRINITY_DN34236_c0_g1_i1.p1 TRINITY_DN34236_c0_g1~~TRINITY_DN34236_c0_g1_i1.p1  ORF type:complete len:467 (-),score=79.62 TRINITY_DN34236_c0_g1_i1:997-2397(-)